MSPCPFPTTITIRPRALRSSPVSSRVRHEIPEDNRRVSRPKRCQNDDNSPNNVNDKNDRSLLYIFADYLLQSGNKILNYSFLLK